MGFSLNHEFILNYGRYCSASAMDWDISIPTDFYRVCGLSYLPLVYPTKGVKNNWGNWGVNLTHHFKTIDIKFTKYVSPQIGPVLITLHTGTTGHFGVS